jgi:mannose-1-phosphate guanylyltransferase
LINGDTLTDVDLAALADQHARTGALVTMALIPNPRPDKYGGVLLDGHQAVTGFTRRGHAGSSFHFIGVQAVQPSVFAPLPDGVPSESVLEVYPKLMAQRPGSVQGFVSHAAFQDIGTPADLLATSLALAARAGRPGTPAWGHGVRIADDARVVRTLIWDNVTVGAGASLTDCIVADEVEIPANARYEGCAIVRADTGRLLIEKLG